MIPLSGELTIQQAAAQRETLRGAIGAAVADVTLELSAVEAFDSAGVQLLLAARRQLASRGLGLALAGCPPVVAGVLATYGLDTAFGPTP